MNEQLPQSTVQVAGRAAHDIVNGLKQQPLMLALVVLQFLIMMAVLYSSIHRQDAISAQFTSTYKLLETCMSK